VSLRVKKELAFTLCAVCQLGLQCTSRFGCKLLLFMQALAGGYLALLNDVRRHWPKLLLL
jgi:hypothetical protein